MAAKVRKIDFSPDEWLQGTRRLDNATRGLYITACALIYSKGGPVEIDDLQTICRDHGNAFKRQLKTLVDLGKVTVADGRIDNQRCENELENARKRSGKASEKAAKRWKNNETHDAGAMLRSIAAASNDQKDELKPLQNNETNDATALPGHLSKPPPQPPPSHPSSSPPSDSPYNYTLPLPPPSGTYVPAADEPRQPIPYDPVKEIFDRGVHLLGGRRPLLGRMVKQYGDVAVLDAIIACENERPIDPVSFLVVCLKNSTPKENGHAAKRSPVEKLYAGAKLAVEDYERRRQRPGDSEPGDEGFGSLLDR